MKTEIGAVLDDRYRLESEIGRGGLGVVFQAQDTLLDRRVAIKVVDKRDLTQTDRQRLLREARLVARLNHPNIIAVHDAGEVDGTPYIVMEFIDGVSLFDQPPQSLAESVDIARQLCQALSHAHAHGVVHRDLKPENILRTNGGAVKLADFGLAIAAGSRISREGVIVGTVFYLAPEQIRGASIDERADLYALGVLLYEWSTGILPFNAEESLAVLTQHLYAPVVPPRARVPDLSPTLDRLIVSLLSKSPEERPASAEQVLAILDSADLLLASSPPAEVPPLDRIRRGRMVGRELELERARQVWSQVQAGASRTLLVCGEAGIGKSRLVRELVAQAGLSGAIVLQGWNVGEPTRPLAVFRQIIRGSFTRLEPILSQLPESALSDLLTLIPEAQGSFPHVELPIEAPPPEARQRLFESMTILLSMVSQTAPTLLVFEDAQWADSASIELLRYLVQQIRNRPVLFVLTFRPTEPSSAPLLHQALLEFQRDRSPISVPLARLSLEGTGELLRTMLDDDVDPALSDRIFRATEGNPFFIEEICKGMAEAGTIVEEGGQWRMLKLGSLEVPANVRFAIRERIRLLPPGVEQALEVAAVRGLEFESELIQRVCHLDPLAAADVLEAAKRADLIRRVGDGPEPRFAFVHALITSAVVEDLKPATRRSLHAQIAEALEAMQPEAVETLAHHYREAGDVARAVDYLLLAGDNAQSANASKEAVEAFSACAHILHDNGSPEEESRALLRLALAYSFDFQFDQSRRTYQKAFDLWESVPENAPPRIGERDDVILRYAMDEPGTLDPVEIRDDVSLLVIGQLMEGLVEIDEAWGIVPAVAARWEVSDGGRRYLFYLRRDRAWSDGQPVTAGDFEYAWKRNLSFRASFERSSSDLGALGFLQHALAFTEGGASLSDVGVKALSKYALEVRLARAAAFFPILLASPEMYPLRSSVVESQKQPWATHENFVGNGPFLLDSWTPRREMIFQRNPHYRGLSRGNVTRVVARSLPACIDVKAYDSLLQEFDEEELDGISLLSADTEVRLRIRAAYRRRCVETPSLTTFYLGLNCSRAPLDDERVRRALALAIDRQALIDCHGFSLPKPGGFLPPGMPGHTTRMGLDFDLEAARQRLAEAGYPDGLEFPEIELLHFDFPSGPNIIGTFVVRPWRSLGIPVRDVPVPWGEFLLRLRSDPPDAFINGWAADCPDPDPLLRFLFHSKEGNNAIRWENPDFDRVLERGASATNPRERIALYQQADRILVEEQAAVIPLWYGRWDRLLQQYVKAPILPIQWMRFKDVIIDLDVRESPGD
jgi:ABC-type oligopeptide transport system substrate-binding subunit